jgi:transposase InsO family protein
MELKERYPGFGAKKLSSLMEGRVSVRTANRLLKRAGHCQERFEVKPMPQPFERATANELWQTDFKRLGWRGGGFEVLSVIDDATRFNVGLVGLPDQTLASLTAALWELFGTYGLPEAILSDNGPAFRNNATWRYSSFDLWLLKLGIHSIHGRPYHPQTQGKVERFHGTLERERGDILRKVCLDDAKPILKAFQSMYNWERPHESLGQRKPGSLYQASPRSRPNSIPDHEIPSGAIVRKVSATGGLTYKGTLYDVGRALAHEWVVICEDDPLNPALVFHGIALGKLVEFRRNRW